LADEKVRQITTALRRHDAIERAWLARKRVQHYPDNPLFVLIVEGNGIDPVSQKTLQSIAVALPEDLATLLLSRTAQP